jgi:hypothetical protein
MLSNPNYLLPLHEVGSILFTFYYLFCTFIITTYTEEHFYG